MSETKTEVRELRYWVGTLESCPIQQLTLQGVSFPRHTVVRKKIRDVEQIVGHLEGALVTISEEKAKAIEAEIQRSVTRWYGKPNDFCVHGTHGEVLDTEAVVTDTDGRKRKLYQPRPGDSPLGPTVCFKLVEKPEDAPHFLGSKMSPYSPKNEKASKRVITPASREPVA